MSRMDALECQYTDVEWYGIDRKGNIAVFLSAGTGNVPEFVCESKERAEALNAFFDSAPLICNAIVCQERSEGTVKLAQELAGKGMYYFDSDDGTKAGHCNGQRYYTKCAYPEKMLKYVELPEHIRDMLKPNWLTIDDFANVDKVFVEHAYE